MNSNLQILLFLFLLEILLELIWILTDYRPKKDKIKWYFRPRALLFSLEKGGTAILLIFTTFYYPLPKTSFDSVFIATGIIMGLSGFILAAWAKIIMKKSWRPAGENINLKQNKLITNGPFAFSRNPIYVGLWLLTFGTFIALKSYLIFIGIIIVARYYKAIIKEEKFLEKAFGKQYSGYKAKVPRFI